MRDTGVGMTPEELGRVFELFYQAPQPLDRPRGGLGIGLTLAQRLARLHGGEIDADSDGRGRGSTFRVSFPSLDSAGRRRPSDAGRRGRRASCASPSSRTTTTSARPCATCWRWTATRCSPPTTARTAWISILRERPDLALVDVGLPRVDGYEVARRTKAGLRRRRPAWWR